MPQNTHIKTIKVVSNTHWDREFRQSFERTRRNLLTMMDTILDILEKDPDYHSFTLDGHTILIDDYLEMRPEKKSLIEEYIKSGRLIAGPWYTLVEEFSVSHEAMARNFLYGKKGVEKYGGKPGTVAYTPSSWGQTGQLPQILTNFGIDKMMFYRGISHHEAPAEYIWQAPDGTQVWASRFALYARYNWYYQVHRPVTRKGKTFDKKHIWGEFDEIPLRFADSLSGDDPSFELHDPHLEYDTSFLKNAIEKMVEAEGPHFTTPIFLAMHGHDISVAYPHESAIIKKAQEAVGEKYKIAHTNLEEYWKEVIQHLDRSQMTVLEGERRSYLKTGMWTYLFPATISARTYLKQQDFDASTRLTYYAEPLASLAHTLGDNYPTLYLDRGWKYLLSNHTHDANGGCAPDPVCLDMEYRYRKTNDISNIVSENAMSYIASHIAPGKMDQQSVQYVVFNPLPFKRDVIVKADLEIPAALQVKSVSFGHESQPTVERQPVYSEKSSVFMDSKWDVPTILDSERMVLYAHFKDLPPLGYRSYTVSPEKQALRVASTLMTGDDSMENEFISVKINPNGTVNITSKETGRTFNNLNYITDQGEAGNAWQHEDIRFDKKINSLGVTSRNSVSESGPLVCTLSAEFSLSLPVDYGDGTRRNEMNTDVPVKIEYTLEKGSRYLKVKTTLVNNAKDHWLRVNFPSSIQTDVSVADSHYDVVERDIKLPDSTGWVEEARGTHPLRTFVDVSDGKQGLACFTKGIFEYEVFDTPDRTLAITLIRACRIKLKVSEEKISELPDIGVQCPGLQTFEYAICPHTGTHADAALANLAAEYYTPARALMAGRGKGDLPQEAFMFSMDNPKVHITAVKLAEDKSGTVIRMYNTTTAEQAVKLTFPFSVVAMKVRMDESEGEIISHGAEYIEYRFKGKEILSLKVLKSLDA
jgi:mannosylglycerate hydrolase